MSTWVFQLWKALQAFVIAVTTLSTSLVYFCRDYSEGLRPTRCSRVLRVVVRVCVCAPPECLCVHVKRPRMRGHSETHADRPFSAKEVVSNGNREEHRGGWRYCGVCCYLVSFVLNQWGLSERWAWEQVHPLRCGVLPPGPSHSGTAHRVRQQDKKIICSSFT